MLNLSFLNSVEGVEVAGRVVMDKAEAVIEQEAIDRRRGVPTVKAVREVANAVGTDRVAGIAPSVDRRLIRLNRSATT